MFGRRPLAIAATAATASLLALTALSGCTTADVGAVAGGAGAPSSPSASGTASATAERVAVIGDSIESGLGLDADEAWPALVAQTEGWELDNLSVPGAGFVAQGSNGADFSAQVDAAIASKPQLVLIGASDNDLGTDMTQVADAMQTQVARLRSALPDARIVGYNALSGEAGDADLAPLDSALQQAVDAVHGSWVDLGEPYRDLAGLEQDDGEHPTLPGQQAIAAVVESKLEA
ncbi:SGNH/GDSL hydrolase family protein [Leifsonia sp. SIMBA_070]|uniref:SGNH/GDSL hydrolase family protein n=1 Tax=Leifsonia sp. SIMBA_070 TaxID=3085810 RepID=UPI00397B48FA